MSAYFSRESEHERAVNAGERALAVATEMGDFALQVITQDRLRLLERAVERPTTRRFYMLQVSWLGEAYLLAGRREEAKQVASRGLSLARDKKERGYEAWVLRLLGDIAAHEDSLDIGKAEDHYRQALALAEELGIRPLIAHCHVGLGKLYRRIGSGQQAEEHLTTATAMMQEMQMGLWLEKAEAELKDLG